MRSPHQIYNGLEDPYYNDHEKLSRIIEPNEDLQDTLRHVRGGSNYQTTAEWLQKHQEDHFSEDAVLSLPAGISVGAAIAIAAIKACIRQDVVLPLYIARSAPAMVLGMLKKGFSIEEIEYYITHFDTNWIRGSFRISTQKLSDHFSRMHPNAVSDLSDCITVPGIENNPNLNIGFLVTEKLTGAQKLMTQGDINSLVRATSAFEPFFEAVEIDGTTFIDGAFNLGYPIQELAKIVGDQYLLLEISKGAGKISKLIRLWYKYVWFRWYWKQGYQEDYPAAEQIATLDISQTKPGFNKFVYNDKEIFRYIDELTLQISEWLEATLAES